VDRRIRVLAMVVIVLLGAVLIQAANVQFRRSASLASSRDNPRVDAARLKLGRGEILAADGSVLAISIPTPKAVYKYQRYYPTGTLMSQIVGVDSPTYGLYGIEDEYNSYLVAHKQPATSLSELLSPTTSTDSVTLTIQPKLQALAAAELGEKDGAVVALNPSTGAIEAMYANPTYEPNGLVAQSYKTEAAAWTAANASNLEGFIGFDSLAYRRTFPPGSTFKVVTSSAVYDLRPDLVSKSYPQKSVLTFNDSNQTLSNDSGGACGGTIAEMLPPSCDTGFAMVGEDVGADDLFLQATAFGWNQVPPIDLPKVTGAEPAAFPTPAALKDSDALVAYSAIGQFDVAATALQNALDASAIANGGVVMVPHLMSRIEDAQGDLVKSYTPMVWKKATTPFTAAAVSTLMQAVVTQPGATASGVGFLTQDDVAAKTGTAQTGLGNVSTSTDDWMIAFAPAYHPTIALAVIVPNQSFSATGAEVAGPIMKCMIEGALALEAGQPVTGTSTTCP
jgi:peptidoglycan glycosyltransferase